MLATLRRIVQEVNHARNLSQALEIIVTRVRKAMATDVCSVYLADAERGGYLLMATVGLNPDAVGRVCLPFGEGIVGEVAECAEPVNLEDAPSHPRFRFIEEADETPYHAFLGVPVIHHRKVLGVLVVQQRARRRFGEDETAFLLTIAAQLAGAIIHARAVGGLSEAAPRRAAERRGLEGLAGAPGVGIGTAMVLYPQADLDAVPDRRVEDVEAEVAVFLEAAALARADVKGMHARLSSILDSEDRALFEAYLQMLEGSSLIDQVVARIRKGSWASGALRDTVAEHVAVFEAMDDPYMRQRAEDVRDIGQRILKCLQKERLRPPDYPDRVVLVGEEITATMLAEAPAEKLAAVVSARGSSSSHLAILARALGVPAVVGVTELPVGRIEGSELIVDGYSGRVYIDPDRAVRDQYAQLAREDAELARELGGLRDLPAVTPDGHRLPLHANTGLIADLTPSLQCGAEGVGLYRTEFPFMVRERFPGEEEQRRIYRQVVESFAPRPVVLRTLDVGGDKALPYFPIEEENPFLGWRGIRITLDHPELFLMQVRAMLRAGEGFDNLHLLLPMISNLEELDEALALVERARRELEEEGHALPAPRLGVMVEVPSLLYQIEAVAARVDFLSIGTNDLTQYLLAVDRNNTAVARLYDSFHPAVVRAIEQVVRGAGRHQKPVSLCGEMAGNPLATPLLLGLGVGSLSMSASALARVKWVVRSIGMGRARAVARHVLSLESAAEIRRYLTAVLVEHGLGGLVRPGR